MTEKVVGINKQIKNKLDEGIIARSNGGDGRPYVEQVLLLIGDDFMKLDPDTKRAVITAKRECGIELTANERVASNNLQVRGAWPIFARWLSPGEKNNY